MIHGCYKICIFKTLRFSSIQTHTSSRMCISEQSAKCYCQITQLSQLYFIQHHFQFRDCYLMTYRRIKSDSAADCKPMRHILARHYSNIHRHSFFRIQNVIQCLLRIRRQFQRSRKIISRSGWDISKRNL